MGQCPIGALQLRAVVRTLEAAEPEAYDETVERIAREHMLMGSDVVEIGELHGVGPQPDLADGRLEEDEADARARADATKEVVIRSGAKFLDHVRIDLDDARLRFTLQMDEHLVLDAPAPDFQSALAAVLPEDRPQLDVYHSSKDWVREIRLSDGTYLGWLSPETLCERYGDLVCRAWVPPVEIRAIDADIGSGLFATKTLRRGIFIGEYTGVVHVPTANERREEKSRKFRAAAGRRSPAREHDVYAFTYHPYGRWSGVDGACIRATDCGNHTRFINHAYPANTDVARLLMDGGWRAIIVANRDIAAGEQIFLNYGHGYWRNVPIEPVDLR